MSEDKQKKKSKAKSDRKPKKEEPKAKQVAPEGSELEPVSGSVMQMEVPKEEPVNAAEAREKEAAAVEAKADDPTPAVEAKPEEAKPEEAKPEEAKPEEPKNEDAQRPMLGKFPVDEEALEALLEAECAKAAEEAYQAGYRDGENERIGLAQAISPEEQEAARAEMDERAAEYLRKEEAREARELERHAALLEMADSCQEIAFQLRVQNGITLKDEIQNKSPEEQNRIIEIYASFGRDFD